MAELHPGDATYMPPLWWHHVESLEALNALVNYWWSPVEVEGYHTGHARAALFHGLLAFRALPPAERAQRRNLLDYYVFGAADAVAHIPVERRSVLGPLTPNGGIVEAGRAPAPLTSGSVFRQLGLQP